MAPALDHIVILVPPAVLAHLPAWLSDNFAVLDGGTHAGGVTENKLVLLHDGVYLELIAFVAGAPPEGRTHHRWGARPEGHIIDWALSVPGTASDAEFKQIQGRVQAADAGGITYADLVAGGRTTPDGVVLKWATSAPSAPSPETLKLGGALPFWCLDRTDRKLRVPYATGDLATHPSGATGVAGVSIHVKDESLLGKLAKVYDAVLGAASGGKWTLPVPETGSHGKLPQLTVSGVPAAASLDDALQGWIELSLFTTGDAKTVSGSFVDGWKLDIKLVKA